MRVVDAQVHIWGSGVPGTLTHREPGAIGGRFSGADTPSADSHTLLDERTTLDRELEGGGQTRTSDG